MAIKANLKSFFSEPFRPFFLGASIYAVITVMIWFLVYQLGFSGILTGINPISWHSYEMIFGFSFAVIAGFLLTAVENWTGIKPAGHRCILLLFMLWLTARILRLPFLLTPSVAMLLDWTFQGFLIALVCKPIIKTKARQHWAVIGKVVLIFLLFPIIAYSEIYGVSSSVPQKLSLLIVLALLLTMIRRLLPFFISKATRSSVMNNDLVDRLSLVMFLGYLLVFVPFPRTASIIALCLFALHLYRAFYWYTPLVFRNSLLWSFYLGYLFLILGFLLHGLTSFLPLNPFLFIHAFSFGGIGLITQSVMLRATLGHSGGDVLNPPSAARLVFILLSLGVFFRVILPCFSQDLKWIGISMILWACSFGLLSNLLLSIITKTEKKKQSFKILHN